MLHRNMLRPPVAQAMADAGSRVSRPGLITSYAGRYYHGVSGYVLAATLSALALAATIPITAYLETYPLTLVLIAVMISAYLGGAGPGALSAVISAAGVAYFLASPTFSLRGASPADAVRLALFLACSTIVSALSERLHRSRARAEDAIGRTEGQNVLLRDQAFVLEQEREKLSAREVELQAANEQLRANTEELEQANGELETFARELARERSTERDARARMERLQVLTAALATRVQPHAILALLVDEATRAVGADAGAVALLDENGTELRFARWFGYPDGVMHEWLRVPLAADLPLTVAVRDQRSVWLSSPEEMTQRWPGFAEASQAVPSGAWAVIPLTADEHPMGAFAMSFRYPRPAGDDLAFAESVASMCAQALVRSQLHEADRIAAERMVVLQAVTEEFAGVTRRADVARVVLDHALPAVGAAAGSLFVCTKGEAGIDVLEVVDHAGYSEGLIEALHHIPLDSPIAACEVVRTGKSLWVNHWPRNPRPTQA